MKAWEKRVLISLLGVSPRLMPKNISDITTKITEINMERPEDVTKFYDAIVLGKVGSTAAIPEDVRQQVKDASRWLLTVVKDSALQETIDGATAHLKEKTDSAQKDLIRHAKEAITKAADNYRPIVVKSGKKTKKLTGVFPEEFERMLQLASARVNQMWVGPAGCGKTFLAGKVAEALDLKAYDQSMSEGISESAFTGWLLPTGAQGKFNYVPSPFIDCYENGGVFLFDEIDAADANLLVFMNKAIANDYFYLPQRFKKPKVVKHPDFVCIGAANTFGAGADAQYVGRNALDAATLDRFKAGMIQMDYSAPVEEALVDTDVLEWGREIRNKIRQHGLFRIMSTRIMLDFTKLKAEADWGKQDWEESYFADWTADERRLVA
jgi:hypothetical protein